MLTNKTKNPPFCHLQKVQRLHLLQPALSSDSMTRKKGVMREADRSMVQVCQS